MGTLGGNLCLDTRCRYVNQTPVWRQAIGGCLKSEGATCHVVPGGSQCVAAFSSDCAPVLIAAGASVVLASATATRVVPLESLYRADGAQHLTLRPGELLTEVAVPRAPPGVRSRYVKWRPRGAIDSPPVSAALWLDVSAEDRLREGSRVVVGVLAARPKRVVLDPMIGVQVTDPTLAAAIAEHVHRQRKPLENVPNDAPYRRQLLRVLVRRAVEAVQAPGA